MTAKQDPDFRPFTKEERIKQLNDIDRSIAELLKSAGMAVKTLTEIKSASGVTPANRREAFASATDTYLKALHSVDVNLKRQINGLDEAGIIKQEDYDDEDPPKGEKGKTIDVGWLNTRSNKVGRDMEAELWVKARTFLEGMDKQQLGNGANGSQSKKNGGDKDMTDV